VCWLQALHQRGHQRILQHTVILCNTLHHTATHCNTLHHTAPHCNTLQHTAPHCNTLQYIPTHCNTLQHTATHCNTLQHSHILPLCPRFLAGAIKSRMSCLTSFACTCGVLVRGWKQKQRRKQTKRFFGTNPKARAGWPQRLGLVQVTRLQCIAVSCSVLQCVAVCCSVLQCIAVCCSVFHSRICRYQCSILFKYNRNL